MSEVILIDVLMNIRGLIVFVMSLVCIGCANFDDSEPIPELGASPSSCYWQADLDAWADGGGTYEARGGIFNEFIGEDELVCADNWSFN